MVADSGTSTPSRSPTSTSTHEQICGFSWADRVRFAAEVGLQVDPRSGPWRNKWVVGNIFEPAAALFTDDGRPLDWTVTHVLLAAGAVAVER